MFMFSYQILNRNLSLAKTWKTINLMFANLYSDLANNLIMLFNMIVTAAWCLNFFGIIYSCTLQRTLLEPTLSNWTTHNFESSQIFIQDYGSCVKCKRSLYAIPTWIVHRTFIFNKIQIKLNEYSACHIACRFFACRLIHVFKAFLWRTVAMHFHQ